MIPGISEHPAIRAAGIVALILIAFVGIRWWLANGHQNPEAQNPPVINNAPSLAFDPAIADQLVGKLPRGKPIDVVAVGSPADWGVASHYAGYLKTKGFEVTLTKVGMVPSFFARFASSQAVDDQSSR